MGYTSFHLKKTLRCKNVLNPFTGRVFFLIILLRQIFFLRDVYAVRRNLGGGRGKPRPQIIGSAYYNWTGLAARPNKLTSLMSAFSDIRCF